MKQQKQRKIKINKNIHRTEHQGKCLGIGIIMVVTINATIFFMTIVYVSFHRAQNRGSRSLRIKIKRRQDATQKMSAKKIVYGRLKNFKRYEVKSINRSIFQIRISTRLFSKLENPPAPKELLEHAISSLFGSIFAFQVPVPNSEFWVNGSNRVRTESESNQDSDPKDGPDHGYPAVH